MGKNDVIDSLRLTRIALLLSGIRIKAIKHRTFLQKFLDSHLYYFNLLWLYTDVFGEINWLVHAIMRDQSFVDFSISIPTITISAVATSKSLTLYLRKDVVIEVIEKLRDIHPEFKDEVDVKVDKQYSFVRNKENADRNRKEAEKEIVKQSKRIIKLIVMMQYYICVVVVVAFPLMPIIAMIYDYLHTGILIYKYPYLANYFFDPRSWTMWALVYIHNIWSTFNVGLILFGTDTLFYVACVYIQMHFRLLCQRFEHVVTRNPEETRRNLTSAVKRHQELIQLVNKVELLFSKSVFFNIMASSFLLCLSGFIIMMLKDLGVIVSFGTFLLHDLSQISLLCYFGDIIMTSSVEISTAIYKSRWYDTDDSTKKTMLMVLIRAQRPCKLTAWNFSDLNMSAFTTILSRSWSYFALLKTMYKP